MITNIGIVDVLVKDVDASKAFYVDTLGFAEHTDITVGDGSVRWCTVMHPNQPELQVHLTTPGPPYSPAMVAEMYRALDEGGSFALGLNVDDCRTTCAELQAKGVTFLSQPQERPYGVEAIARDNSGNWLVLVEHRDFTPEDFSEFTAADADRTLDAP